jgi:hypothetical protein
MPSPHAGALLDYQLVTRSELPSDYRQMTRIDALGIDCPELASGCRGVAGVMCSLRKSTATKGHPAVPLMCSSRITRAREMAPAEVIDTDPEFVLTPNFNNTPSKVRKTPELVADVKRRRAAGETLPMIAKALGISPQTVFNWSKDDA